MLSRRQMIQTGLIAGTVATGLVPAVASVPVPTADNCWSSEGYHRLIRYHLSYHGLLMNEKDVSKLERHAYLRYCYWVKTKGTGQASILVYHGISEAIYNSYLKCRFKDATYVPLILIENCRSKGRIDLIRDPKFYARQSQEYHETTARFKSWYGDDVVEAIKKYGFLECMLEVDLAFQGENHVVS